MQQAQGEEEEAPQGRQQIGPLAALDHDVITYQPFAKDFYTPVLKMASMTPGEVGCHPCSPARMDSLCTGATKRQGRKSDQSSSVGADGAP
jgi:hypothetical protein